MDTEMNASENLHTQSDDSDKVSAKQAGRESSMKQSSAECDEAPVANLHENEEKNDDPSKSSQTIKKLPKSDNKLVVLDDKHEANAHAASTGDNSQGNQSFIIASRTKEVDSISKVCEEDRGKQGEDDRNVQAEEDLVYSGEEEEEEYLEDEDEDVPIRNRRRHFGDSDEEESCDEEEEIVQEEPRHVGTFQTDNESGQDQPQVEDGIADREKNAEGEVGAKAKRANRRDPTYVPREGAFFMHDARDASDNEESGDRRQSSRPKPSKNRPGITAEWSHDLYDEREQQPLSTNEIISRYGYNIRDRRADQIDDAASPSVRRRSNNYSGRGRRRFSKPSQNPPPKSKSVAFAENDFPSLQEAEELNREQGSRGSYHQRRGGFTFSRRGNSHPRRPDFRSDNPSKSEESQNTQTEPQRRHIRGNRYQRDEGILADSQNRPHGRPYFHPGSSRRNLDPRPGMDVLIYNSNSKRYSANRPQNSKNSHSQRQPTRQVVIRDQPKQSQRSQNDRSYNNNRSAQRNEQNRDRQDCSIDQNKG
nr:protein casc3 [Hymenolepis microstoma]